MHLPIVATLTAAGLVLICVGGRASDAHDPSSATWGDETYEITSRHSGDAVIFELSHDGNVVGSVGGSTDTLCDSPYLRRYDVDGDGSVDLVVYDCGRLDAYTLRDHALVGIPYPGESLWANEISWRGLRVGLAGALLLFIGLGGALRRFEPQTT